MRYRHDAKTPDGTRIYAIGDMHGRLDLLQKLEALIEADAGGSGAANLIAVYLGDYIDRGPDSKGVIDFIMQLQASGYRVTALKGNHEESCVNAWKADKNKKRFFGIRTKPFLQKEWEQFGGKQTLASFGTDWAGEIPEKYIRWMDQLELFVETEKFIAVHAGLNFDAENPFEDTRSMLWIRELKHSCYLGSFQTSLKITMPAGPMIPKDPSLKH